MARSSASPGRRACHTLAAVCVLSTAGTATAQIEPGPEFRVNTYTTGSQRGPAVAVNRAGYFVVAWESAAQDGDQGGVFAQMHSPNGTPFSTEFAVNTYTTSSQHAPAVAMGVTSAFVVVWESLGQDGDGGGVFGQRYGPSGGPLGGEFRVNTYTASSQGAPKAASAVDFVVVWESLGQDGSGSGVFGQRYDMNGNRLGGEFRVNTYTTGFQGNPAVAMSPEGHFVVVWEADSAADQQRGVFAQRYYSTGDPLGGEFRVNSFTTGNQRYPSVSVESGAFAVVWQSDGQDGSGYGIFTTAVDLGTGTHGTEFRVNNFTTGDQTRPEVRTGANFKSVVTWESDDAQDPQGGIFAKLYYGHAIPLGTEFRVNTQTSGAQTDPGVALAQDQGIFIAWTSDQDPAGGLDVYAEHQIGPWLPVELQSFTIE